MAMLPNGFTGKRTALLGLVALGLTSCASTENPVSGQREFTTINRAQEQKIGDEQHPKIMERFGGGYKDPRMAQYINDLGQQLAANSHLAGQQRFTFTLLDSPDVNAFATPGGYVYITRGIMALAQSEAELAGVIGHEIGHVTARHSAQRNTRQQLAGIGALAATIGAAALGAPGSTVQQIGKLGGVAAKGSVASFSRAQELEADNLGIEYMTKAGYDPLALSSILASMRDQEALHSRMKGRDYDPNTVGFFSTHPATGQRVARSTQIAQQTSVAGRGPRNEDRYMQLLNGMVYGDSREQGYVRNNTFWHPDLGFAFDVPRGWDVINKPQAIGIFSSDKKALAVFERAKGSGSIEEIALSQMQVKGVSGVSRPERITINGRPAVTISGNGKIQGKAAKLRIIVIDAGNGRQYQYKMISDARSWQGYESGFVQLANSFRAISAGQAPQPLRIVTRRVQPGETVASIAAQTAFPNEKTARFAVMNGLAPGQPVQPGQWVKLVQ